MLLINRKKRAGIDLLPVFVQRAEIILHGQVALTLLLVDETHVAVDGAKVDFHFSGTL